jgi:dihydroorotate dehydrogenase
MIWKAIKPFLFLVDAETAHYFSIRSLSLFHRFFPWVVRWINGISEVGKTSENFRTKAFGLDFYHPVGLAAGFDKNGEYLPLLQDLGFSFVEVGTVTPLPQPGNNRPRLFRDPNSHSIFNRMGFNGAGALQVAQNLSKALPKLRKDFRIGLNIGKNKETSVQNTPLDYKIAVQPFEDLINYVVINVSSPNTPGLRDLQTPQALKSIFEAVHSEISKWAKPIPILIKLAPEIESHEFDLMAATLEPLGLAGWVFTNTLGGTHPQQELSGGWSGGRLTQISRNFLLQTHTKTKLPIISVGGIMEGKEACFRLKNGASLIQVYSGWVYAGPRFVSRLLRAILQNQ